MITYINSTKLWDIFWVCFYSQVFVISNDHKKGRVGKTVVVRD